MLLTSVRVSPWSCLWTFCSVGRVTMIVPSSRETVMSGWRSRVRVPLGPVTVSRRPSIVTSTDEGTAMGRRPIRDIVGLPDERQDFTAELGLLGLRAGHDPLARADDDDAQPAEHARDVGLAGIDPQPGLADPLQPGHDRHLAVDVLEGQAQDERGAVLLLADAGDEALVHEDPGDLALRPRRGHDDLGVARPGGVPHAGQHVGDRIGDVHLDLPARLRDARQLAQQGALPEADPAEGEPPHVGARAPAHEAAAVAANLELGLALRLGDHRFLGHGLLPRYEAKGMPRSSSNFLLSS